MGIFYGKELTTKDRRIMPTGPRDRQLKHARDMAASVGQFALVDELRSQIGILTDKLSNVQSTSVYTDEQVNEALAKSIKAEVETINIKHDLELSKFKNEVSNLNSKIDSLNEIIKIKDDIINQLKTSGISNIEAGAGLPNAPVMENVFIDPIDRESNVEKHIDIISEINREKIDEKTKKLKSIFGGKSPIKGQGGV